MTFLEMKSKERVKQADKWRRVNSSEEAIKIMERENGELKILVQNTKVLAGAKYGSFAIHEFRAEAVINGKLKKIQETVPVGWLKDWGIIKRWDSFRKSEAFLNTDTGKIWLGYFLQEVKPELINQ
ncbi:hypothetical protein SAMN05192534_12324 [Alteribacillus persepolensis]|uniref:Uncharacterized protein n=1 Tax=Alteribacillus persepolensis TaxID=568899 RepID=A0A1G8I7B0_9BACI|nr:hypothetical protein [Alteribacillus persepolensis]SDI14803.1 hypothetical protein SAMN05192534_12324 [Alteribacillus persepolensis]